MKNKEIFKIGDEVFVANLGWGTIEHISRLSCSVKFDNEKNDVIRKIPTDLISFTEYTLDGFSDERPINYSEYSGDWGKFWNDENKDYNWVISRLLVYNPDEDSGKKFTSMVGLKYEFFEPLTEEQIKILGLE